jgi:hypothetical protein
MTTETPLTCYIRGRTDDWVTVDMIGLFEDQAATADRFEETRGRAPESYPFVCPGCEPEPLNNVANSRETYGVHE